MGHKKFINSETIVELFGLDSDIYKELMNFLKENLSNDNIYENNLKEWNTVFTNIYGNNLSPVLFLKHTYFVLILKIVVVYKISLVKGINFEEIYSRLADIDKEVSHIFNFNFLFWITPKRELFEKVLNEIQGLEFVKEDIFSYLYQHIFVPVIRHKRGEFFTPTRLVNKMVDNSYRFGSKVLDPSCGSGTFLISIILKIFDSNKSNLSKFQAFSNVFGFDVNPLAIITTKANIFLLIIGYLEPKDNEISHINIFHCDSLFPEDYENKLNANFIDLYNSFDLIIGNPPWITYKDLNNKAYQNRIRELTDQLNIKPSSQYITHIELAAVFFYAIPLKFLKKKGEIFFVMPKSCLNGDHCYEFRSFSIFNADLEIWDFPNNYFFNVEHVCLKAEYIGINDNISTRGHYPINAKIFDGNINLLRELSYSSLKVENDGARLILPEQDLKILNRVENSVYKKRFVQGATLVPRTLVFFQIRIEKDNRLIIDSDPDVLSRAKEKWMFRFQNKEIENKFHFKTFLNIHLIPFHIKILKDVFLPVDEHLMFNIEFLQRYPKAFEFYNEINNFYLENKKETSDINTLSDNLNYWNKLQKQVNNKTFIVVYNASGSNLKAAVINNEDQKVIIGSENYYFSTDSEEEAYYLSAILNAPNLSRNIKIIKSSRHIHKRPFNFPIPNYNQNNIIHKKLAKKGKNCHIVVQELFMNNPKITSKKARIFINRKLVKIEELTDKIVFK
ncbi:MAG: class I SAM-dependent DNA methyltransferase [Candidatus Thorarchaeota archaeon]